MKRTLYSVTALSLVLIAACGKKAQPGANPEIAQELQAFSDLGSEYGAGTAATVLAKSSASELVGALNPSSAPEALTNPSLQSKTIPTAAINPIEATSPDMISPQIDIRYVTRSLRKAGPLGLEADENPVKGADQPTTPSTTRYTMILSPQALRDAPNATLRLPILSADLGRPSDSKILIPVSLCRADRTGKCLDTTLNGLKFIDGTKMFPSIAVESKGPYASADSYVGVVYALYNSDEFAARSKVEFKESDAREGIHVGNNPHLAQLVNRAYVRYVNSKTDGSGSVSEFLEGMPFQTCQFSALQAASAVHGNEIQAWFAEGNRTTNSRIIDLSHSNHAWAMFYAAERDYLFFSDNTPAAPPSLEYFIDAAAADRLFEIYSRSRKDFTSAFKDSDDFVSANLASLSLRRSVFEKLLATSPAGDLRDEKAFRTRLKVIGPTFYFELDARQYDKGQSITDQYIEAQVVQPKQNLFNLSARPQRFKSDSLLDLSDAKSSTVLDLSGKPVWAELKVRKMWSLEKDSLQTSFHSLFEGECGTSYMQGAHYAGSASDVDGTAFPSSVTKPKFKISCYGMGGGSEEKEVSLTLEQLRARASAKGMELVERSFVDGVLVFTRK